MSLTITSTKSFSGTAGNYSLSESFTGSALSSASETVNASSSTDVEIFANNSAGELKFMAIKSDKEGSFTVKDSSGATLGTSKTLTAGVSRVFFGTSLTGVDFYNDADIASIDVANSDTSVQAAVSIDLLYDATP